MILALKFFNTSSDSLMEPAIIRTSKEYDTRSATQMHAQPLSHTLSHSATRSATEPHAQPLSHTLMPLSHTLSHSVTRLATQPHAQPLIYTLSHSATRIINIIIFHWQKNYMIFFTPYIVFHILHVRSFVRSFVCDLLQFLWDVCLTYFTHTCVKTWY